jgi:uncharacterized phage-like protein YoqJ
MSKEITCLFTGHRDLGYTFSRAELKEAIENMIDKGVKIFIAGGALGFDTEAAIEVLRQKKAGKDVSLHIYAPCQGQSKRFSFREKMLYNKILKHADYVDMPDREYFDGCMKIRNYKMVDASSYVIAYYSGQFKSGTGQTVRYAQKCGLEIINLYKE